MARKILGAKKQPNKQIFMITDGKPSMIKLPDGSYYKNSFGLDPKIVQLTLDEAALCQKKRKPFAPLYIKLANFEKGNNPPRFIR